MKYCQNVLRYYVFLYYVPLFFCISISPAHIHDLLAAQVTLQWDGNPEPDITGYKVHYGTSSGSYDQKINVGKNTTADISSLAEGTTYYFTVTAYTTASESDYSNEVSYTPDIVPADGDDDGVPDTTDNCPVTSNTDQTDTDGDGIGDACDPCPADIENDADNDNVCGNIDNCPEVANSDQADTDADGIGDACEKDTDLDGIIDDADACPADPEKSESGDCGCGYADTDSDDDTVADCIDNCPSVVNPDQTDTDNDGIGDACEHQIIFYDDFSSLDYSSWLRPLGAWKIMSGVFLQTYSRGRAIAVVKDMALQDYTFSADVKINTTGQTGLVFRYKDTKNYYCFYQNAGTAWIIKYVNGKTKYLTSFKRGLFVAGQTYKFTVKTQGRILECLIDDVSVFQVADSTFSTGTVGLYTSSNGGGVFDEVVVVQ